MITIDDVIERLNELKSQHGNVPIVIADQSSQRLFCGKMRMEHRVVYGQDFYVNFSDTPITGDKAIGVVVVFRESR